MIRDRLWLSQKHHNEIIYDNYFNSYKDYQELGSSYKGSPLSAKWWDDSIASLCSKESDKDLCIKRSIENHLGVPNNDWRGYFAWDSSSHPFEKIFIDTRAIDQITKRLV